MLSSASTNTPNAGVGVGGQLESPQRMRQRPLTPVGVQAVVEEGDDREDDQPYHGRGHRKRGGFSEDLLDAAASQRWSRWAAGGVVAGRGGGVVGGGDFGRYGLSYGAFVWRGSGLFTELVALEVMLPTLGLVARSIDSGKGQTGAALGLALTSLSHTFFGYIAFVSAAVWALVASDGERPKRVVRALSIAAERFSCLPGSSYRWCWPAARSIAVDGTLLTSLIRMAPG